MAAGVALDVAAEYATRTLPGTRGNGRARPRRGMVKRHSSAPSTAPYARLEWSTETTG
jgi:hypothetical protein